MFDLTRVQIHDLCMVYRTFHVPKMHFLNPQADNPLFAATVVAAAVALQLYQLTWSTNLGGLTNEPPRAFERMNHSNLEWTCTGNWSFGSLQLQVSFKYALKWSIVIAFCAVVKTKGWHNNDWRINTNLSYWVLSRGLLYYVPTLIISLFANIQLKLVNSHPLVPLIRPLTWKILVCLHTLWLCLWGMSRVFIHFHW